MAKKLSALTPTGRRALLVRLFERIELELNSTPEVPDLKDLNARLLLYEKLKGLLQEIEMKPKKEIADHDITRFRAELTKRLITLAAANAGRSAVSKGGVTVA